MKVLGENQKDPAALASLDRIYESQGMYENLAAILRQRLTITDDSDELVDAEPAPRARLRRGAGGDRSRDRQLPRGAGARSRARATRWTRSNASTSAASAGRSCTASTRSSSTSPRTTSGLADCYARMAKLAADALDDREKAVELWGRVVDIRGEDAIALSGLADLHEMAGEWKELTEVLEKQVVATPDPEARIPIYKRLGRIWGEKLSRERNSLESWQKVLEIDPQDVDALRAIAANYKSAGAWEELSQALRRLIQVGQLGGSGIERDELKELFSQLGELEGDTLMRTQDAIDAWREVLELDEADFRALAALERLFMQEARWEEAVDILERRAQRARQPERPRRRPDAGGVAVGRQDRRRRFGRRGVRARAADRSGPPARVGRAGAAVSPAQELGEAGRPAAGADRVLARRGDAHRAARAGVRDLRAAARRSGQRVRDVAGGVPRGLLQRPRRQGAGTAGDRGRQVERADRRVHPGRPGDLAIRSRPPTCG